MNEFKSGSLVCIKPDIFKSPINKKFNNQLAYITRVNLGSETCLIKFLNDSLNQDIVSVAGIPQIMIKCLHLISDSPLEEDVIKLLNI